MKRRTEKELLIGRRIEDLRKKALGWGFILGFWVGMFMYAVITALIEP